jgi:4-amino-4-deoxy-L-arabinose transferase-like glycosyltransferase
MAARVPSALSVLGLGLVALWAGRAFREVHREFPVFLALSVLGTAGVIEKGRLAEIEAVYVSLAGAGMLMWAAAWKRGAGPWGLWLPACGLMGLAMLAKGPVFLAFFLPVMLVTMWQAGELRRLRHPAALVGLALVFLVSVPWAMAVKARLAGLPADVETRGPGEVWMDQVLGRLMPAKFDVMSWVTSPLDTVLALSVPAVVALVWWRALRRGVVSGLPVRDRALLRGLAWGSLASGLALSLIPEPHARFQLPLAAPVALLAVWLLCVDRGAGVGLENEEKRWRVAHGLLLAVMVGTTVCGALLPLVEAFAAARMKTWFLLGGSMVPWVIFVYTRTRRQAEPERLFTAYGAVLLEVALLLAFVVMPRWAEKREHRRPAAEVMAAAGEGAKIAAMYPGPQPFLFYLGAGTVECAGLSAIPEGTTHVLVPVRKWGEERTRKGLEKRGFAKVLVEVEGRVTEGPAEAKRYVLVGR